MLKITPYGAVGRRVFLLCIMCIFIPSLSTLFNIFAIFTGYKQRAMCCVPRTQHEARSPEGAVAVYFADFVKIFRKGNN